MKQKQSAVPSGTLLHILTGTSNSVCCCCDNAGGDQRLIQPEEEKIAFATNPENRGEHLTIYCGPGFVDIGCGCGYDIPIKALACISLMEMMRH